MALLFLPVLAAALLAAHFYRGGSLLLAVLSIAVLALLAVPRAWAARALQCALVIGAFEWLHTLSALASIRLALGQPVLRLALILAGVALFTAASAAVFRQARLKRRYRL